MKNTVNAAKQGLFIGMITSDVVYLVDHMPGKNEKMMADEMFVGAGGPAGNASVAFAAFGNSARLAGAAGSHTVCEPMKRDLENHKIEFIDLAPNRTQPPVVSSIMSLKGSGERAVVSMNAPQIEVARCNLDSLLHKVDVILVDGHQMEISLKTASIKGRIPMVADAGSWKQGFESLLPFCDYVICSADFIAPQSDVFGYLQSVGVNKAAVTHGAEPIEFMNHRERGRIEVEKLGQKELIDTMGAGDVFHGAFCHYILINDFVTALNLAAKVATLSCRYFTNRKWIRALNTR